MDVTHRFDKTIRLSFRMNNVHAGHLNIPDIPNTLHYVLQRGTNYGSFYKKFTGELPTFTHRDDAAVLTNGQYALSYKQYGPDDLFAISLKAVFNRDTHPSLELYLSPRQSQDFLGLLQTIADTNLSPTTGQLVLANGTTTPNDVVPPSK